MGSQNVCASHTGKCIFPILIEQNIVCKYSSISVVYKIGKLIPGIKFLFQTNVEGIFHFHCNRIVHQLVTSELLSKFQTSQVKNAIVKK